MICRLRSLWGTLTMAAFWRSLAHPPLVVFDGHVWEEGPWGQGFLDGVVVDCRRDRCAACGHGRWEWRRWWGAA